MAKYIIGIDIGTQGTKTVLLKSDGVVAAESFEESNLINTADAGIEQDAEEILQSCINTIKDVIKRSGIDSGLIESLAIDGQMAGVMGVGADGKAVTPYDSWLDQRCGKYWPMLKEIGEEKIISITGCPITYAHGPKKLWWKHERPEIYEKITAFVQPGAYAAMRLCDLKGNEAFIDHTYLHFTGFADTRNKVWSHELLDSAGISISKMPRIVKSYEIVGHVSPEMAKATGLKQGMPVAAGCGDTAASTFGAGIVRPGKVIDVAGTASVFACAVNSFASDINYKTMMFAPSVIDGLYTPMAYINGGGLCLKWFRDELVQKDGVKKSYRELDEEAEQISAGSDGLLFTPHFAGRVCPNDGSVRGGWIGLNLNHNRSHMYRSIMEGIAYEYKMYLDILNDLLPDMKFDQVISVGGGAKSQLMKQIKADILGIPMTTISRADTGVLGSAVIAGYAVGIFDDLASTVESFLDSGEPVMPKDENSKIYEVMANAYRMQFDSLKPLFDKLSTARLLSSKRR
jgi:xylulokinase